MTYERTLSHCQTCGKAFCPEEGGPECNCGDYWGCPYCDWRNADDHQDCQNCFAWRCEECGWLNHPEDQECFVCREARGDRIAIGYGAKDSKGG